MEREDGRRGTGYRKNSRSRSLSSDEVGDDVLPPENASWKVCMQSTWKIAGDMGIESSIGRQRDDEMTCEIIGRRIYNLAGVNKVKEVAKGGRDI